MDVRTLGKRAKYDHFLIFPADVRKKIKYRSFERVKLGGFYCFPTY